MSRLESNSEPSMEEILASIRKIIAEDSSGLRSPAASSRPGAAYTPSQKASPLPTSAPQPRSGFMSREAFMRSSQAADPGQGSEYHAPVGGPRAATADVSDSIPASSRSRAREESRPAEKPASPFRDPSPGSRERDAAPGKPGAGSPEDKSLADDVLTQDATRARSSREQTEARSEPLRLTPESDEPIVLNAVSAETVQVETVTVEDVTPVAEDDTPSTAAKAGQPASGTPVESDAARIEAQLSELLSEDLNALREGRLPTHADAPPVAAGEPQSALEKTPLSGAPSQKASDTPVSDPFAFDLGPSPFAAKSETQRSPASAQGTATPRVEPVSPSSDVQRPAAFTRPDQGEPAPFKNGSSAYPAASGTSSSAFERPLANPQPEPATAKPRQTFAVPSVSATLGPTRRLEPLSNAFRPAPPVEPFVPAAEVIPEPVASPQTARAPEPPATPSNLYDDLPPLGGLPAISSESGLDRPMEDAVADLLRPLLKTWLAENMPKIVERALRREMSERLLPGQKNPRT